MHRATVCTIAFLLLFTTAVRAQDSLYFSIVSQNGWFKAINKQGKVLADSLRTREQLYVTYDKSAEGMFIYMRNYKIGFKDHHNRVVVPAQYCLANLTAEQRYQSVHNPPTQTVFFRGQAVVGTSSQTFGIIDRKGRLIADTIYSWISAPEPQSGVYVARIGERLMILDRKGRNILSKAYVCDTVLYPTPAFYDGLLCVMLPQTDAGSLETTANLNPFGLETGIATGSLHRYKAGFVNATGRLVINTMFTMSSQLLGNRNNDYHRFWQSGRGCGTGRANAAANWRPAPDPFYLNKDYYRFEAGRCLVNRNGQDFVIDLKGDSLFAVGNTDGVLNYHGYFICQTGSSFGSNSMSSIYKLNGQLLSVLGSVRTGEYDFFLIDDGGGGGYFMDGNGNLRFGERYDIADPFYNGFARVKTKYRGEGLHDDEDYGHLDTNGKFYPVKKYWVLQRSGNLIITRDETSNPRLYGVMDENEKWVIKPKYKELMPFCNGMALVSGPDAPTGKWGFMNEKFQIVIPEVYDRASDFVGTIVP